MIFVALFGLFIFEFDSPSFILDLFDFTIY